jgi:hypothetical protein
MTNDEIANRIAEQMNNVIEGITGSTTQAIGERVIKVEPTTQDQIDVEKELAFSQGYDHAVQDIMQIIREQELMNDALGRIYGEDLHVIRNRIKELQAK